MTDEYDDEICTQCYEYVENCWCHVDDGWYSDDDYEDNE